MRQTVFMMVFFLTAIVSSAAFAGDMEPADPPGSTSSYTLEDVYNRLNDGTAGSPKNYAGPTAGPAPTGKTLNEVMGKAPQKDDINGATVSDVTKGKKFWGLNTATGQWGLQTGITCSSTSRWCDNEDNTVTDMTTGLVWMKNANCTESLASITFSDGKLNWLDAVTWSSVIGNGICVWYYSEEGTWHLPTKNELAGITQGDEAVSSSEMRVFTGIRSGYYWSATSNSGNPSKVWLVHFGDSSVSSDDKTGTNYVWPVRGRQ